MSEPKVEACPYEGQRCPSCGGDFLRVERRRDYLVAQVCGCGRPCPRCDDTGFVTTDEGGYAFARPCARARVDRRARWLNEARLPGRYVNATLATFTPRNKRLKQARSHALRFAIGFTPGERGVLYYGRPGTGKTHLLVALLRYLIVHRGLKARFVEFAHLLADLRATFGGPGARTQGLMEPLARVPILAIDELGKGRQTSEWELQVLDELITRRYNSGLTTLFTTNFYPGEPPEGGQRLEDRVGVRVYSRLQEMCEPQHLIADDFRAEGAD